MNHPQKRTIYGPGINVVLDASEFYEGGTPSMVNSADDKHSATYWCALDNGELDQGDVTLTGRQVAWLNSLVEQVEAWESYWKERSE